MKSSKNMKTIQIDITNACPNKCGNCTRFCGWHEKTFFMDFETFKKAVDSLDGYDGMVGIMGGQPTLHPQFDKFVDYLISKKQETKNIYELISPEDDFNYYINSSNSDILSKRGLWSCCGDKYYENFEKINKTFRYQCLNDHYNPSQHQALLVARKDLGITDCLFEKLRDKCWINNLWSSSITPKGCFFCEVAAALDELFDGPGGLPIEKGWWLRRPQDFGEQLNWCEYCSACLKVPSKDARLGIDIISPTLYEKLKDKNSYKAKNKMYELFTKADYEEFDGEINQDETTPYLKEGVNRIDINNNTIKPHKINFCYVGTEQFDDKLLINIDNNFCFKKGNWITKQQLENKQFDDWCLVIKNNWKIDISVFERVFNPGVLYINQDYYFINKRASFLKDNIIVDELQNLFDDQHKSYVGKFHVDNQDIKYSFLMPTYNSSKIVETALQSILNQDYSNFNIYFCDDCSTDNTVQILEQYMKKDSRIKKIQVNEKNSSAVVSRNRLIEMADGDYAIWVDSDDEVNTNICSFATWLLHQEKFEIINFPFKINQKGVYQYYAFKQEKYKKCYGKDVWEYYITEKENPHFLWCKVIDVNLLKKMKVQDVSIYLVDDNIFSLPLYWNCKSYLNVCSEKMYIYNYGCGEWGNLTFTFDKYKRNVDSILKALDINYKFILEHCPQKKNLERMIYKTPLFYIDSAAMMVQQSQHFLVFDYRNKIITKLQGEI